MKKEPQIKEKLMELIDEFVEKDDQFHDYYQTQEQQERDCEITKLLRAYVDAYNEKVKAQKRYRNAIAIVCLGIVSVFSLLLFAMLINFGFRVVPLKAEDVISLVSVCITFLVAVLGLVKIITKYCFPKNDEAYIAKIVETIQANDLAHKLANMKGQQDGGNDSQG